jgi:predicted metalloprotease with PDZ domain
MIEYRVSLLSISQQTLMVSVSVPALEDVIDVTLPTWIPGSYMVRDFARNLGEFKAVDATGVPLNWKKIDKQSWQVQTNNQPCTLNYTVVANDFSVRGAYIKNDYAFMNGTSVFVDIVQGIALNRSVVIESDSAPSGWHPYTAMEAHSPNAFQCDTYTALIDHPIYWGRAQVKTFTVQGVEFSFLLSGEQPIDVARICDDLVPICDHHLSLFNAPSPVNKYLFITLLADTGFGGLEHRDSTVLMYPRFELPMQGESTPPKDGYIDYLSLCSHEFFHTWHVKRLRPKVMLQPDLSKEVYTEQLWIYEGITSFYDDLAVARAGKMSPEHYLTIVGRHLTRLYHTPGRHKQTPAESSFDAWTRFYKQDANSNNHIVSYYTKGGIVAMGLDLLLRKETGNKAQLDDVMRYLWANYGQNEIGTPDDVIQTACASFDVDIQDYLDHVVFGTKDVDLKPLLSEIGLSLELRGRANSNDKGGTASDSLVENDFGALVKSDAKGCKVTQLQEGSAAEKAGLMIGDVIVAADEWVIDENLLMRLIQSKSQGETMSLNIVRQGRLIALNFPIQAAQQKVAHLVIEDKAKYLEWLGVEA